MAMVEFSRKELERLIGRKLSQKEIEEEIPMIGCVLEKQEKDKLYFEIFPNRPDMLSIEGFARAMKNFLGVSKTILQYDVGQSGISVNVDSSVKSVRPYIVCAAVKNVSITEEMLASFMQVQEKLHDTLGRKRRKVAIGIHDLDKVTPPFTYKAVDPKTVKFVPLDMEAEMSMAEITQKHKKGIEYAHIVKDDAKWPVIVDKNGSVLSFPPIINGELTRVTDKTKNLFIDITGTSVVATSQALNIIATSLYDRGFKVESVEIVDKKRVQTPSLSPWRMKINIDYANKLLDMDLNEGELKKLLQKMGYGFDGSVLVPCYRTDVMHEIDIVEDIAIAHGYRNFDPKIPKVPAIAKRDRLMEFCIFLKDSMNGSGAQEAVTMLLTNRKDEFEKMCLAEGNYCQILNSVSVECEICRTSVLPSLLKVLFHNKNREYAQKIFEVGDVAVFEPNEETGAKIMKRLAYVISDSSANYSDVTSTLDSLMTNLSLEYSLKPANHSSYASGRVAQIIVKKTPVGYIGEISPEVLEKWNLEMPVAGFEIDADKLLSFV